LRERFWANGFESDQTLENPEPKLAPLPSSQAVSSEIGFYRDIAHPLEVKFQIFSVAERCVLVCVHLLERLLPLQACASEPLSLIQPCASYTLPPVEPLINPKIYQAVCQQVERQQALFF
jgi:hypothetical protein